LRVTCGAAACGSGESSCSAPTIPARTIDEYNICPYRGYLTAVRALGGRDHLLASIAEEDSHHYPDDLLVLYYPERDPPFIATFTFNQRTGEQGRIIVRSKPDMIVAVPEHPGTPILLEITRTPIDEPATIRHIIPRTLLYAETVKACWGVKPIPMIASSSSTTRHHAYIPLAGPRLVEKSLRRILDSLESPTPPRPRTGAHCDHCTLKYYCPIW